MMMVMIIERSTVDSGLGYEFQSQMVWIKPCLCHLVALWPWSIHITFLCLCLLIYKIGTTVPISRVVKETLLAKTGSLAPRTNLFPKSYSHFYYVDLLVIG